MTALVPATSFLPNVLLNPKGRPHMDGRAEPGHDDVLWSMLVLQVIVRELKRTAVGRARS